MAGEKHIGEKREEGEGTKKKGRGMGGKRRMGKARKKNERQSEGMGRKEGKGSICSPR